MPTQFRYQTPARQTGVIPSNGEDWARIDLNLDGRFEIILPPTSGRSGGIVEQPVVILNYDPAAGFSFAPMRDSTGAVLTTSWVQDMIVADFNGDGRPDLLIGDHGVEPPSGHVGGRLQLWLSSANGPVVSNVSASLGPRGFWHATGAADFNRDGLLDVFTINLGGEFISSIRTAIFTNSGGGVFALNNSLLPSTADATRTNSTLTSTVGAGDLDRDGLADLVWAAGADLFPNSVTAREARVYFGQPGGLTNSYVSLPFLNFAALGIDPRVISVDKLKIADFNGDGLMDVSLLMASSAGAGRWGQIWIQGPNRTFSELKVWPNNVLPQFSQFGVGDGIVPVDINGDGLLDIHFQHSFVNNLNEALQVTYINMGDGSYRPLSSIDANILNGLPGGATAFGWTRWGDLDGDGQVEFFGSRRIFLGATEDGEYFSFRLGIDALQVVAGTALTGTIFGETITGTASADIIDGWLGHDRINAGAGDDRITGGYGNDAIDGGAGIDTAVYRGLFYGYSSVSQTRVVGGREGGADTLTSVERLRFLDGTLSYETGSAVWTQDEATIAVARLYQVCLGRAPDIGGLEHYRSAVDQGYDLMHFTRAMIESPEFISRFGTLTNQQFVQQIYRFVLGREGDAGGVATYTSALSQGYTRADVVLVFSESPENKLRYQTTWETTVRHLEDGRYRAGAPDDQIKDLDAQVLPGADDDGVYDPADLDLSPAKDTDAFVLPGQPDGGDPPWVLIDANDLAPLPALPAGMITLLDLVSPPTDEALPGLYGHGLDLAWT